MSRYIDADKLTERIKNSPAFENMGQDGYFLQDVILDLLGKQPTADVVEVVRCKDCKYRTLTEEGEYNPEDIVCVYFMTDGMQANDYCSYGERSENGTAEYNK